MKFLYTKYQVARGAKADAEVQGRLYLIKNVSQMRLTYQIKLLTFAAKTRGLKLVILLPKEATVHESLKDYVSGMSGLIDIERS